jgi:hypothetical protein
MRALLSAARLDYSTNVAAHVVHVLFVQLQAPGCIMIVSSAAT